MNFPDLIKDPADIVPYAMDWSSRLPSGKRITGIVVQVNGDCAVTDGTAYPATALALTVAGGSDTGFTGDPQVATLSVVTIVAQIEGGLVMSRSFNVIERQM